MIIEVWILDAVVDELNWIGKLRQFIMEHNSLWFLKPVEEIKNVIFTKDPFSIHLVSVRAQVSKSMDKVPRG